MSRATDNDLIPAWVDGVLAPMGKLETHARGLRHPAVSVFVMAGDQTLIQRRALGKYHTPGLWANSCCTHPHWGESAADCAARRVEQELGLSGLALNLRETVEYRAEVGNGLLEHEVVDIFIAQLPAPVDPSPDPAEVMETRWVSIDTLCAEVAAQPAAFTPWLRIYLADHHHAIFGAGR